MRRIETHTLRTVLASAALTIAGAWALGPVHANAAILTSGLPSPPYGGFTCADVVDNSETAGVFIQNYSCHGGSNQDFQLIGTAIYALSGQRCLDVQSDGNGGVPGTPVDAYVCTSSANQKWYYFNGQLINMQYNLCLDATDFANKTVLVVNTCNKSNSQQWQFK